MKERFHVPDVKPFLHRMSAVTEGEVKPEDVTPAVDLVRGVKDRSDVQDKQELAANDLKVLAWARSIFDRPGFLGSKGMVHVWIFRTPSLEGGEAE